MQEIPYSIISQCYQEEYSQQQSESVYGSPKKHLLPFFQVLESSEDLTTVLDLGCGDGANTIALAEKGYHVTGIDMAVQQAVLYRDRQKSLD